MDQWLLVLTATGSVFAVIGVGMFTRYVGWLTEEADESLLKLCIELLYPCLIFSTISDNPALRETSNILLPPVVGFSTVIIGLVVAWAVMRLSPRVHGLGRANQRYTFIIAAGIYNYGFIPIPLISMLFDDANRTLGVLFVHNTGTSLAIWTVGIVVLCGGLTKGWWRNVVNMPTITIVISLLVNLTGVNKYFHHAEFLLKAIESIGDAAIPLSILLVGATITDQLKPGNNRTSFRDAVKVIGWGCFVRILAVPALFLLIAVYLPCSPELRRVIVIQAAMPSAVFSIILARMYGGDAGAAIRIVVATSALSLVTVPLWISLGLWLIG